MLVDLPVSPTKVFEQPEESLTACDEWWEPCS